MGETTNLNRLAGFLNHQQYGWLGVFHCWGVPGISLVFVAQLDPWIFKDDQGPGETDEWVLEWVNTKRRYIKLNLQVSLRTISFFCGIHSTGIRLILSIVFSFFVGGGAVDGWNPAPPGMVLKPYIINNGKNYQPQLVIVGFQPSTGSMEYSLGGGFKYLLIFIPTWGRWTHFDDHIFQMGWFNHQLDHLFFCQGTYFQHLFKHLFDGIHIPPKTFV